MTTPQPPAHDASIRAAFHDAVAWFLELAASVPEDAWTEPGLGEWDLRELVAHTSRALTTIEAYLAEPAGAIEIPTAIEYFRRGMAMPGIHPQIAQRGRDEVAQLGDDPLAYLERLADRVERLVAVTPGHQPCATIGGAAMELDQYLITRIFELTVHSVDLASALGRTGPEAQPPVSGAAFTLHVLGGLAAGRDDRAAAISALTGRASLPPNWSALG